MLQEVRSAVRDFITRASGRRYRVVVSNGVITVRLPQHGCGDSARIRRRSTHNRGIEGFQSGNSSLVELTSRASCMTCPFNRPGQVRVLRPAGNHQTERRPGRRERHHPQHRTLGELTGSLGGSAGGLRRPGSTLVVGGHWGPCAPEAARSSRGAPENTASNWWSTGTASCEPGPDYQVPAGRYEVVVPLDLDISGLSHRFAAEGCIPAPPRPPATLRDHGGTQA